MPMDWLCPRGLLAIDGPGHDKCRDSARFARSLNRLCRGPGRNDKKDGGDLRPKKVQLFPFACVEKIESNSLGILFRRFVASFSVNNCATQVFRHKRIRTSWGCWRWKAPRFRNRFVNYDIPRARLNLWSVYIRNLSVRCQPARQPFMDEARYSSLNPFADWRHSLVERPVHGQSVLHELNGVLV